MSSLSVYADVVAAIAVVLSLLFVAWEMHQANKQAKLSNWRALLDQLVAFKAISNDLAMSEVIERGMADYDALAPHERRAFGLYLEQAIHVYGNFPKHSETIPTGYEGLHEAVQNSQVDLFSGPGARAWWAESREKKRFMRATIKRIDGIVADAEASLSTSYMGTLFA